MKNVNLVVLSVLIIIASTILIGCEEKVSETSAIAPRYIGLKVDEVRDVNKALFDHLAKEINSEDKLYGIEFQLKESVLVSYKETSNQIIYTPTNGLKNNGTTSLLSFVDGDNHIERFLYLTEKVVTSEITNYTFQNLGFEKIITMQVNKEGIVINLEAHDLTMKDMPETWGECVLRALEELGKEPVVALACIAFGKWCAGGIAFMCLGVYQ